MGHALGHVKNSQYRDLLMGADIRLHIYTILFAADVFNKRQKISLHKVTKLSVSSLSLLLCYQIADTKLPVTNCQLTNFRFYLCTNCLYQIASYQFSVTKLLL